MTDRLGTAAREREMRAAHNQSLFREVNERIQDLNDTFLVAAAEALRRSDYVCECADDACFERVSLTREEYESVRAFPSRFAVAHGHVVPDVEDVVATYERFVVVEKRRAGKARAEQLDPRSPRS